MPSNIPKPDGLSFSPEFEQFLQKIEDHDLAPQDIPAMQRLVQEAMAYRNAIWMLIFSMDEHQSKLAQYIREQLSVLLYDEEYKVPRELFLEQKHILELQTSLGMPLEQMQEQDTAQRVLVIGGKLYRDSIHDICRSISRMYFDKLTKADLGKQFLIYIREGMTPKDAIARAQGENHDTPIAKEDRLSQLAREANVALEGLNRFIRKQDEASLEALHMHIVDTIRAILLGQQKGRGFHNALLDVMAGYLRKRTNRNLLGAALTEVVKRCSAYIALESDMSWLLPEETPAVLEETSIAEPEVSEETVVEAEQEAPVSDVSLEPNLTRSRVSSAAIQNLELTLLKIQESHPEVRFLTDVTLSMLREYFQAQEYTESAARDLYESFSVLLETAVEHIPMDVLTRPDIGFIQRKYKQWMRIASPNKYAEVEARQDVFREIEALATTHRLPLETESMDRLQELCDEHLRHNHIGISLADLMETVRQIYDRKDTTEDIKTSLRHLTPYQLWLMENGVITPKNYSHYKVTLDKHAASTLCQWMEHQVTVERLNHLQESIVFQHPLRAVPPEENLARLDILQDLYALEQGSRVSFHYTEVQGLEREGKGCRWRVRLTGGQDTSVFRSKENMHVTVNGHSYGVTIDKIPGVQDEYYVHFALPPARPFAEQGHIGFAPNPSKAMLTYLGYLRKAIQNKQTSSLPRLLRMILGTEEFQLPSLHPIDEPLEWHNKHIAEDPSQELAVRTALSDQFPITLIQGPPGTGKTSTTAEIIHQCYKRYPKSNVVVLSHSHKAVDTVVERVLQDPSILPIRVGNDTSKITSQAVREQHIRSDRIMGIFENPPKNVVDTMLFAGTEEGFVLDNTAQSILKRNEKHGRQHIVIIDEASMSMFAETLYVLNCIPNVIKLIFVGDQKQLPPFGFTNELLAHYMAEKRLDTTMTELHHMTKASVFEKLVERGFPQILLDINYRSANPRLTRLFSHLFYECRVQTNGQAGFYHAVDRETEYPLDSFKVIDYSRFADHTPQERRSSKNSYDNPLEADCVAHEVFRLLQEDSSMRFKDISVITYYTGQVQELRKAFFAKEREIVEFYAEERGIEWEEAYDAFRYFIEENIQTVDTMQGNENEVVILSCVRSNHGKPPKTGFIGDLQRTNVALSRAKNRLIVVGDFETLTRSGDPNAQYIFSNLKELITLENLGVIEEIA